MTQEELKEIVNDRQLVREKINGLIFKGDWFDIVQMCKNDPYDYAIYYLIQVAIGQQATINHIKTLLND